MMRFFVLFIAYLVAICFAKAQTIPSQDVEYLTPTFQTGELVALFETKEL